MNLRISLFKSVLLFLMLTLPFANISNFFDFEDGLIFFLYPICFALFIFAILQNNIARFPLDGIVIVIYIVLGTSIASYLAGNIDMYLVVSSFFKFALFILIFDLVKTNGHRAINFILDNYSNLFFWSLFLSLVAFIFVRKPEFIFYDGSANRFGGFHFELFNFCFSTSVACASLIYKNVNKLFVFSILCFFLYLSKSNFSFIYVIIYLISFHTNLLSSIFLRKISTIVVLGLPVLIGMILDQLSFLTLFSLRETTSFDHSGSSAFTRLYPYSLAYSQLISDGIFSFLPSGFGYFESTDLVKNDEMSYEGTGSPKAIVNLGVILFAVLGYIMMKKVPKVSKHELSLVNFIWFSTLAFISFGSGFFNLFAWAILASLFFWKKSHV